jgi:hypothetical protein
LEETKDKIGKDFEKRSEDAELEDQQNRNERGRRQWGNRTGVPRSLSFLFPELP